MIYAEERLGQFGRPFQIYKIRTMYKGADEEFKEMLRKHGATVKGFPEDYRVTLLGKILRPTHLDEFPQVYNVLRGDMQWVGIRPKARKMWDYFPASHVQKVLQYKPGAIPIEYSYDNLRDEKDIMAAHDEYLWKKEHGKNTDAKYLVGIINNICF